jgi:class 3 adenylate cyclase/tetratricopeptide (TPR) repeat protein
MDCPQCGHRNEDGARFCGECGESLAAAAFCPECGTEAAPGQKFCTSCGTRLAAPSQMRTEAERPEQPERPQTNLDLRSYMPSYLQERIRSEGMALEGERKQVTVLFADVTGSMELAGSVDPETWRGVMDRFFSLLCDGVHRFEGTVNKFTGDGIMALFGAPLAHEDHAKRACYAALHLRDELARYAGELRREHGLNFSVRMGINSGEVVVGAVGEDLNVDYTAIGHTVGLASRIEALAEPGKVYVTEGTAHLTEGWFRFAELGAFELKGVPEPVRVFELGGTSKARTRVEAVGERGLSRFVGREQELGALEAALAHAHEADGQVVGIVADPGLGKSRLCYEFVELCRARGLEITQGHGVAHGKRIPLLPVIEMMRDYFGIADEDSDRQARDKIAGRLLLLDDEFKQLLPVLFDFLGVPDADRPPPANPEARHRQLVEAVRRLVQVAGQQRRGVILIEDLHWLDPGSEVFLEHFVDALPGTHTLVVVNFRPEYRAEWMRKSYYQQLPLLPLGADAMAELLRDLLGPDPSLDGLAELIQERTGGNPFYLEEVVQSLVDSGALDGRKGAYRLARSVDDIAIPATVQAVLAARIDRLQEREKHVLQAASVIGREFSHAVLSRVVDLPEEAFADALRRLTAAEFVFERSLYPEPEYSFKHPLTEEVAYRSQLGERRGRAHAAVAQAIAEVYAERLDEMAAVIANHWEQSNRSLEAAQWNARAAAWAGQNHPADALRHWRRVRSLLAGEPDSPESLGLRFAACLWILQLGGWRMGMPEQEMTEIFEEGARSAGALGDRRLEAAIGASYSLARGFLGNVQEAVERAEEAHTVAEAIGDTELAVSTGNGYWQCIRGNFYEALVELDDAIARTRDNPEMGRHILGFSVHAWAHVFKGFVVLPALGRYAEALPELDRGLALAREYDDVESMGWAHGGYATLSWMNGEAGSGLAHARECLQIAERIGSNFSRAMAHNTLCQAHMARGEWDDGIRAAERGLEILRESHAGLHYEPYMLALLANALWWSGDAAAAVPLAEEALEKAEACGTLHFELEARIALARALLSTAQPDLDRVRSLIEQADELVKKTGARFDEPWIEWTRADMARVQGDLAAHERHLRGAQASFAEFGCSGWAEKAGAELATLPIQ